MAFESNLLYESSEEKKGTASEILAEGVPKNEWDSFLSVPEIKTQGFIAGNRLITITKMGGSLFSIKSRTTGLEQWARYTSPRFIGFLLGCVLFSTLWLYALSKASMLPMADLRRSAEDILAGKYEIRGKYRGQDNVGAALRALRLLCKELEKKDLALEKTSELALTDALTGLKNHRAFKEFFSQHIGLTLRHKHELGFLILDVDHFKKFNDSYGHQVGDEVLQTIARTIKASARSTDLVARYGGEEFVVVLPNTNLSGVRELGEKLRKLVEATPIVSRISPEVLHVTASFGGVAIDGSKIEGKITELMHALVQKADENLYKAKKDGRNRVVVSA